MNTTRKFWLVLMGAVLTFAIIACSCSSLLPLGSTPSGSGSGEAIPGLAGKWRDTSVNTVHTIAWQNGKYVVLSSVSDSNGAYTVSDQSWDGSTLKWSYSSPDIATVTIETVSVSGNSLNILWSSSNGSSGDDTFTREP